jgi:hypothetical protein
MPLRPLGRSQSTRAAFSCSAFRSRRFALALPIEARRLRDAAMGTVQIKARTISFAPKLVQHAARYALGRAKFINGERRVGDPCRFERHFAALHMFVRGGRSPPLRIHMHLWRQLSTEKEGVRNRSAAFSTRSVPSEIASLLASFDRFQEAGFCALRPGDGLTK